MKMQVYKTVSKRSRLLLELKEGYDVEFKRDLGGLDNSDIVAFANSPTGGTMFIGISEESDGEKVQRVSIYGCRVGDEEKQAIISKAQSCLPPVSVELYIENTADKPFFCVEIPSGPDKPYCTAGGNYRIRGDGRSNPLLPGQLLSIFIERESEKSLGRFQEATKQLAEELRALKERISAEIAGIYRDIREMM